MILHTFRRTLLHVARVTDTEQSIGGEDLGFSRGGYEDYSLLGHAVSNDITKVSDETYVYMFWCEVVFLS
jgi:hypothetical protein